MAQSHVFAPHLSRRSTGAGSPFSLVRLMDLWRSRRALAKLDEAALRDVGLDAAKARTEAQRPVWDVPQNWRM